MLLETEISFRYIFPKDILYKTCTFICDILLYIYIYVYGSKNDGKIYEYHKITQHHGNRVNSKYSINLSTGEMVQWVKALTVQVR